MLHSTKTKPRAPKFEIPLDHVQTSSSSSCDDSSQSVGSASSISSLLNGKFGSAYKKRKIRQKVEAVMGSVESVRMTMFREGRNLEGRCCTKLPISA